jgi:hypothetical protein
LLADQELAMRARMALAAPTTGPFPEGVLSASFASTTATAR